MKKFKSLKIRQDIQRRKTVKIQQLPLKREYSNFKTEMISSMENVGDKRVVYMEWVLIVWLIFFPVIFYVYIRVFHRENGSQITYT